MTDLSFNTIALITVIGFVLFVGSICFGRGSSKLKIERRPFLTKAEIEMLGILQVVSPGHHVSYQVSMGALLKPKRGVSKKEFWQIRGEVRAEDCRLCRDRSGYGACRGGDRVGRQKP